MFSDGQRAARAGASESGFVGFPKEGNHRCGLRCGDSHESRASGWAHGPPNPKRRVVARRGRLPTIPVRRPRRSRAKEGADEVEWTSPTPLGLSLSSQDSAARLRVARVPCGSRSGPSRLTGWMPPQSKRHPIPVSRERRPLSCPSSAASAIEERPRAQKVGQEDHLQESKV